MTMTFPSYQVPDTLTPQREYELASELLGVRSEAELDHFLPLLAMAAPLIGQIAGPLLKTVAGSLFGGGSSKKSRPQNEQEYFLGGIIGKLFGGELETESYEQEQFLGGILKGILGGEMETESYEQEQFLGGLLGKVFGGEMEAESYEQEQFLGGILKGIIGGEVAGEMGPGRMMRRARRFVRLVHMAARHAAAEIAAIQRAGRPADEADLRMIVLRAIVNATRQLKPHLAAAAFPGGVSGHRFEF
jgi:hypothetical protein